MWTVISSALIAGVCFACLTGCIVTVRNAVAERESLLKRLRSCESKVQSNADSVEQLTEMVATIAQQQKMQRVRKATTHATGSSGEPDARSDPEAWRAWKNAQLRSGVFN